MSGVEPSPGSVEGERAAALIHRVRGLQSRFGSVAALGLMVSLGVGAMSWYYVHLWHDRKAAKVAPSHPSAGIASDESTLPPLGRIDSLAATAPASAAPGVRAPASSASDDDPDTLASRVASASPPGYSLLPVPASEETPAVPTKSAAELTMERRLAGAAFVAASTQPGSASVPENTHAQRGSATDELSALLQPTETAPVRARRLPSLRLLLPKGAFIDCTLETAIDSTLPGLTTCITATDTFGADGEVVLLERGSKLVGEVRGQVRQGMARVFVLWTEARTPDGIVVPLDSPGTDELGRAGLPGRVNRHFWQRFGAAMLISVLDAGVQAGVQASNSGGGTLVVNPSGTEDVMTEVLRGTVDIPPTIVKRQGDRIQVLVARDLDFRSVYALRATGREAHR